VAKRGVEVNGHVFGRFRTSVGLSLVKGIVCRSQWSTQSKAWTVSPPSNIGVLSSNPTRGIDESKAWTVFARLNIGVVNSSSTRGNHVFAFDRRPCCPVCRYWPCDGLIARQMGTTVYRIKILIKAAKAQQ
jgi:hypothetical protein